MKQLYHIDIESMKRASRSIKKQNPSLKYTQILNDIAISLGYLSYNDYEFSLTQKQNKQAEERIIKSLNFMDAISLKILEKELIQDFNQKGYLLSSIFFIDRIIDNQKECILNSSSLTLKNYMYYLPLFIDNTANLDKEHFISKESLIPHISALKTFYYDVLEIDKINQFIDKVKTIKESNSNLNDDPELSNLKSDLKTKGLYYYLKSLRDEIIYDEGYLTKLILEKNDIEQISSEIYDLISSDLNDIGRFVNKLIDINSEYYTQIRNHTQLNQKMILGINDDGTPFLADLKDLRNNIMIMGLPGSGSGMILTHLFFQSFMNGRGGCIYSPFKESENTLMFKFMTKSLNRIEDFFSYDSNNNSFDIPGFINNDKIIIVDKKLSKNSNISYDSLFQSFLLKIDKFIFSNRFKKQSAPFYVCLREYLEYIDEQSIKIIKKLNYLGIYFIFKCDSINNTVFELCPLKITSADDSSLRYATEQDHASIEANNFFNQLRAIFDTDKFKKQKNKFPFIYSINNKNNYICNTIINSGWITDVSKYRKLEEDSQI